jgi:hypothetical protein
MAAKPDYRDDRKLTLAAKGLFAMLIKRQNDKMSGDLGINEIARLTKDGPQAVRNALNNLEAEGYLQSLQNADSISIDGKLYNLRKQ